MQNFVSPSDVKLLLLGSLKNFDGVFRAVGFGLSIIAPNTGVISSKLSHRPYLLYVEHLNQALSKFTDYDESISPRIVQRNQPNVENC